MHNEKGLEVIGLPNNTMHNVEGLEAIGLAMDMPLESDKSLEFRDWISLIVTNCRFSLIIIPRENLILEELAPVLEPIL